ncbi:MAG: DUF4254 domain-containing protein [Elusimicrobia bacterium]|nr:DUF4254 domain-containing protein [Elusimicrobiota bacterium]MBD3412427.1 DUF4254 domain-containing protein [Elusimicrobiota bacterium]
MAETIGSLVDKISIVNLKLVHMHEQTERRDALPDHKEQCAQRIAVLKIQHDDLCRELDDLITNVRAGKKKIKVYRQYKMYNDPRYRASSSPGGKTT